MGTSLGVLTGLVLGRSEYLSRIFEPYIVAMNSIPRIALVPLIILICGLGDLSKVVTAGIVVFFVVFFNTFEGTALGRPRSDRRRPAARGQRACVLKTVDSVGARLGLRRAHARRLVRAHRRHRRRVHRRERGLGKLIIEAEARANSAEMMVAIFVMIVGIVLSFVVRRVQAYLLRWQPQFEAKAKA